MTERDAERGDDALETAAARVKASIAEIDLTADLHATVERTSAGLAPARRRPRRAPVVAWSIAASIVAVTAGFLFLSLGSDDEVIAPGDTEPTVAVTAPTSAPSAPATTVTAPTTDPVADAGPSTTVVAPTSATVEPGACLPDMDSPQIANELFVEQMLIARSGDGTFAACLDAVPAAFDGAAPGCWTPCDGFQRTFSERSVRFGEFFDPASLDPRYSGSVAVSYSSGGEYIDVVERWELTRTDTGWRFDDFAIDTHPIERGPSSDVINEYFAAIDAGDWTSAARMLDDGAINSEERTDLQRLAPATFEVNDIAAALRAWCADGCDTRRVEPGDLAFDGSYRLERRGHVIGAAWFEGLYSIAGLPFRGDGSSGPETFTTEDLADGVDLAIDGPGVVRAVLYAPASLSDADAAALDASGPGDHVLSAGDDDRFDHVWLLRGDLWCSRRPVIRTELTPAGTSGSIVDIHVARPARLASSDRAECAEVDALAIGFDLVDGIVAFGATFDSATPIADASAVATTPDGLVLDPHRREFATPIGARTLGTAYLVADAVVWQGDNAGAINVFTDTNEWTIDDGERRLSLLDAGIIDDRPTIVMMNRFATPATPEQSDDRLQLVDIASGDVTDLGSGFGGWETGVYDARILRNSIALLRFVNTGQWIELIGFDGESLSTTMLTADRGWRLAARDNEVWAIDVRYVGDDFVPTLDVVRVDAATGEARSEAIVPDADAVDLANGFCSRPNFFADTLVCDLGTGPPIEIDVLAGAEVRTVPGSDVGAVITERRS